MGLRQLEAAILAELREVTGRGRAIRQKDITEWSSGPVEPQVAGELVVFLPRLQLWVGYFDHGVG